MFMISLQSISATNITVHPGGSIQTAVNNANNGDTITVYDNNKTPYTYKESIAINKKVNIKSSGNVTIEAKDTSSSVFTVNPNGAGSTIQNFTMTKSDYVVMINNAVNCTISNNIIKDASLVGIQFYGSMSNSNVINNMIIGLSPTVGNGISFEYGKCSNNIIYGNIVKNFLNGIIFNNNTENNTVQNNQVLNTNHQGAGIYTTDNSRKMNILGNTVTGAEDGIAVEQLGTNTPINYYIDGNTVTGNKNGFWICLSNSTISNNTANGNLVSGLDITGRYNSILNNTASNNENCGITLGAFTDADYNLVSGNTLNNNQAGINSGSSYSNFTKNSMKNNSQTGLIITGSNCNVVGNSMSNNQDAGLLITGTNNLVIKNSFEQNLYGASFSNHNAAIFNFNSLVGNTYQVYSPDTSGFLNAVDNWWGSNSAPSKIYGYFTVNPWIILKVTNNNSKIGIGDTSTITADLTKNSNGEDTAAIYPGEFVPDGLNVSFNCDSLGSLKSVTSTINGFATSTFTSNNVGVSTITAALNSQILSTTVSILTNSFITINPVTGYKGDTVSLIANLKDKNNQGIAGKSIRFSVDGILIGTATTNGSGTATLQYLIANTGTGSIVAQFLGDSAYASSNGNSNIVILLTSTNIAVNPTAGCKLDKVNLITTLKDNNGNNLNGKTINYYINGVSVGSATTNTNGIATYPYTITQNTGTYTITATYPGDTTYSTTTNTNTLTVNPTPTSITTNPSKGYKGDNVNLISTLKDNRGINLSGKTINYYINGVLTGASTTNANGIDSYQYTINQNAGTYEIQATYPGDISYATTSNTNSLTVDSKPTNLISYPTTGNNGDTVDLISTLKDNKGANLSGKTINYYINGVLTGSATTNTNGIATYQYTITQNTGTYTFMTLFSGDMNYATSQSTNILGVNQIPTSISINPITGYKGNTVNLTVVLKDYIGSPLEGKIINYYLNGASLGTATTNTSGIATYLYTITQNSGSYTILTKYLEDSGYGSSNITSDLKVNLTPTKITINPSIGYYKDKVKLTAILINTNNNSLLAGKVINFYVNSKMVGTGTTNSSGFAYLLYTITNVSGKFNLKAQLNPDSNYNGCSNISSLTVRKITTATSTIPVSGTKYSKVKLSAKLVNTHNKVKLVNKPVRFYVNGNYVGSAVTNKLGVSSLYYIIKLNRGKFTITVKYQTDPLYNGATATNTLKVV